MSIDAANLHLLRETKKILDDATLSPTVRCAEGYRVVSDILSRDRYTAKNLESNWTPPELAPEINFQAGIADIDAKPLGQAIADKIDDLKIRNFEEFRKTEVMKKRDERLDSLVTKMDSWARTQGVINEDHMRHIRDWEDKLSNTIHSSAKRGDAFDGDIRNLRNLIIEIKKVNADSRIDALKRSIGSISNRVKVIEAKAPNTL